ncbi:MAG: hypothetical protein ACYCW6_21565, partial [Candidatus Xenobia bacterium]
MRPRTWRATVLAIMALAVAVRLWAPWRSGLFNDEIFCYYLSRLPLDRLLPLSRYEDNTIFSYLLYHPVVAMLTDMRTARWVGLVSAVLAIPFWMLSARRLADTPTAIAVGVLSAITYSTWIQDTAIRIYGLLTLCFAVLFWTAVRACSEKVRPHPGWILAALLLPWLHLLGLALAGGLLLTLLLLRRASPALGWTVGLAVAIGLAQMLAMSGHGSNLTRRTHSFGSPWTIPMLPSYLTGMATPWCWNGHPSLAVEATCGLLLWAAVLWGAGVLWKRNTPGLLLVAVGIGLPLAALTTMGLIGVHPFDPRYMAPVASLIYLLIFCGLPDSLRAGLLAWLCIGNLGVAWLFPSHPFLWNQDWAAAARFVEQREHPGDVLVAHVPYSLVGFNAYYHHGCIPTDFPQPRVVSFPTP